MGGWELQTGFAAVVWDSLAALSFSQCPVSTLSSPSLSDIHSSQRKGEIPVKAVSFWVWEDSHGLQMVFMESTHIV